MRVKGKGERTVTMNTVYEMMLYFFFYGFVGWVCEVIYAGLKTGRFVNRGYLLGPICPIYGFGMTAVLWMLEPLRGHPISVFILAALIASALELAVGILSEKLLHVRLWDYSDSPLNIGGYICLPFSLLWGVGGMAVFYGVQPPVAGLVRHMPHIIGIPILCVLSAVIIADAVITTFHALHLDERMRSIEELSRGVDTLSDAISGVSDKLGQELSDGAIHLKNRVEAAEKSEAVQARYRALVQKKNVVHEHLFSAFDRLKTGKYRNAYDLMRRAKEARKNNAKKK